MGWRVRLKVGKRILYSRSYKTLKEALEASRRQKGARGVVKS